MNAKPQWKRLGPEIPASATIVNIITRMKQIFLVSSSYWLVVEGTPTGSNAFILTPLASELSGSMFVVLAGSNSGSTAYRSPDTNAGASTRIQLGIAMSSGSFTAANSATPFGAGVRWSRYWNTGVITNMSACFAFESEDAVFLGFKNTSRQITGGFAGAVLDAYDSGTGERGQKAFGMITTGINPIPATFWNTTDYMSHTDTADSPHAGVFTVSGGIANRNAGGADWTILERFELPSPMVTASFVTWDEGVVAAPNGQAVVGWPINFVAHGSALTPARAVGRSRGIYMTADNRALVGLMISSTISGAITLARDTASETDAIMVAPVFGSGLT